MVLSLQYLIPVCLAPPQKQVVVKGRGEWIEVDASSGNSRREELALVRLALGVCGKASLDAADCRVSMDSIGRCVWETYRRVTWWMDARVVVDVMLSTMDGQWRRPK